MRMLAYQAACGELVMALDGPSAGVLGTVWDKFSNSVYVRRLDEDRIVRLRPGDEVLLWPA
jgi:hypothetical protein